MLPVQYGEDGDGYGGERYGTGGGADLYSMGYGAGDGYSVVVTGYGDSGYDTDDRYGTGSNVGGERYGVGALLYGTAGEEYGSGYGGGPVVGEHGDGYDAVLDAVDPFDYLDAAPDDRCQVRSGTRRRRP